MIVPVFLLAMLVTDAGVIDASPTGILRGQIFAKGSRDAIPVAEIFTTDGSLGESDEGGRFAFPVPCGTRTFTARAPGYSPQNTSLDPCQADASWVARLEPLPDYPVFKTVVLAEPEAPAHLIHDQDLTRTPGSLGDPFRVIESLPGVSTVASPAPLYAIRGSNPGNTGFFLDDLALPTLFHLALGPAVIHPYFLESMSFHPGGYPARYGRYVGGTVTAQTRTPDEDRVRLSADVRLYDAGAMASSPWPDGKGGAAVAFRYSYTGALFSLMNNSLHLSYWDYQVRLDRRVGRYQCTLLLLGSGDVLDYQRDGVYVYSSSSLDATKLSTRPTFRLGFHRASARVATQVAGGTLALRVAAGMDSSQAPLLEIYEMVTRSRGLFPRLAYQRTGSRLDWDVGLDGQVQWYRPSTTQSAPGMSDLVKGRVAVLSAAYVSATARLGRFTLTPGLRLDDYRIGDAHKADLGPRLAVRFRVTDDTWLTATGGRFSQAPSLLLQLPGADNFGLALYGLQSSWQAAIGVGTRRFAGFTLELTGYVQRYTLTDQRDTFNSLDPLADDFLVRREALSEGIEVMIRRDPTERLHGWLSYTYSVSRRSFGGGVIGPSEFDQRHVANLVLGYRLGWYTVGVRGHVNTGRPFLVQGEQTESFERLPTYYQLDLRVDRRFLFRSFRLDVFAEVVNTTRSPTVFSVRQTSSGIDREHYRFIIPSLGVHGEF